MVLVALLGGPARLYGAVFNCASGRTDCLAAAINAANENGTANTINLAAGPFQLSSFPPHDADGHNGLPSITGVLTINGDPGGTTNIYRAAGRTATLRVFHVAATGNLTLTMLTLWNGSAEDGGAIFNRGTLLIRNCSLSNNNTYEHAPFGYARGGGIFNAGTLTVVDSTIVGNLSFYGGGIFNDANATAFVINSTIGNNGHYYPTPDGGGGIFNSGSLLLSSSTVSGNTGGVATTGGGPQLVNVILAGNGVFDIASDCVGVPVSLGHNIIGDTANCSISLIPSDHTGDPGLGAFTGDLAHFDSDPGGGVFPLLDTSPAIDAGDNAMCPFTDQLGQLRIKGHQGNVTKKAVCDIGAVEAR